MEMKWYAIYTKPNWEKKVTATLSRKKILHYCPINTIFKEEIKTKNYKDLSGYVFVKVYESQLSQLRQIKGLQHLLYWMQKPAVLSEFEIITLKRFLNEHSHIKLEKRKVGFTNLTYDTCPQEENQGKLVHINNNKLIAALPSLGFIMSAEYEKPIVRLSPQESLINPSSQKLILQIAK